MHFGTLLTSLLKGKFIISTVLGIALVSGATAAAFASPTGQQVLHTIIPNPTVTPANHGHKDNDKDKDKNNHPAASQDCSGQPEAQRLAMNFGLNATPKSPALLTLCALHQGTFKGTSSQGTTVPSQRVLGYGEIAQVLTQAQQLATKAGKTMNNDTLTQFVADVLESCNTMPIGQCLHIQPNDKGDNNGHGNNGNGHGNNGNNDNNGDNGNGHGNGNGK